MSISEEQFVFIKGKSTTYAIFELRQRQERYREGQQDLHLHIDLEKTNESPKGRTVVYEREGNTREVHQIGEEHASSELPEQAHSLQWKLATTKHLPSTLYCLPS